MTRRSGWSAAAAGLHGIGYAVLSPWSIVGLFMVLRDGTPGIRPDEVALLAAAGLLSVATIWLTGFEFRQFRVFEVRKEWWLSRVALGFALVPALLSGFWWYEYLMFGSFAANAVPAAQAFVFAGVWFGGGMCRLLECRRRTRENSPQIGPELPV